MRPHVLQGGLVRAEEVDVENEQSAHCQEDDARHEHAPEKEERNSLELLLLLQLLLLLRESGGSRRSRRGEDYVQDPRDRAAEHKYRGRGSEEEEPEEESIIVLADAVVYPGTVVVHLSDASVAA